MLNNSLKSTADNTMPSTMPPTDSLPSSSQPDLRREKQRSSPFQNLFRGWGNLSLRWKLSILFVLSTAIPIVAVTQVLTSISEDRLFGDLKESVQEKGTVFTDEYVLWTKEEAKADAGTLVRLVEGEEIDLNNPQAVAVRSKLLEPFLRINNDATPESIKSFKILTDAQGQTVAQSIQVLDDDFSKPPKMPASKDAVTPQKYRSVSLPLGIPLGDVPIVQNALKTGKPLAGMELIKSSSLQRLGLDKQADVGLRAQVTKGLSAAKAPAPEGTYDIEAGKIGLVSMAVYPIKVKGRLVGTAIVGTLMNRNYGLTDRMTSKYKDIGVATIFAQDLRVSTNVPYVDPQTKAPDNTRAISTRLASEVTTETLNKGQRFVGKTNVAGLDYLTTYNPLYDHQKDLDPQAKPIGTTFVAKPLAEVNNTLRQEQLAGYGIGGGILLLAVALAFPIAGTFSRPLKQLADSARRIKAGEQGVAIAATERQDEVGQLSSSLSSLLDQLTINEELRRQEAIATERLQQASEAQQESEILQTDIGHILDVVSAVEEGDLTVQAEVSDRMTGLVSDTLNRSIEQLGQVLSQVLTTAQQVSSRASRLEEVAETIASNALAQANEVTQVLSLTQQVEQSAQSSAEEVNLTNQSLLNMQSTVEQGQGALDTMNQGISVLQDGTDRIVQQMKALGEFVGLAEQFVQEQGQIASLTQVLSLNATLVAARASEQRDPRQFMVVAREFEAIAKQVSNLAQQTNDGLVSLQQRTSQINTVVSAVDAEVQNLGGLVSGFTTGVDRSNETFANVRTVTAQVAQAGRSVAQSNQEIVNAAQLTAKAMGDIANLAERTTQQTKGSQIQSKRLENLSAQLLNSIQFFRLPENPQAQGNVLDSKTFEANNANSQAADVAKLESTSIS